MKHLPVYIVLIIAANLVAGCNLFDSRKSAYSVPLPLSSFPLTPGSSWTYAVSGTDYYPDSTPHVHYTVNVTILKNEQIMSNELKSLWRFQYTGHIDTVTVSSIGDTVRVVPPDGSVGGGPMTLIFPISVGKKWSANINDSYTVDSNRHISLNGMNFNNTYHIVEIYYLPNEGGDIEYWIQPDVGIVKAYQAGQITVSEPQHWKRTWTLLSFKIKS